jgi:type I restriction enzyme, R subunit
MTATPRTKANLNTYMYFGRPVYTYTLKQGIGDGYLSPYSVIRVTTDVDIKGWRPKPSQKDKYGNLIPDKQYDLPQFDRKITLEPRIMFVAAHLVKHLQGTNPYDKTLVFCQDQQHALDMTTAINNSAFVKHPRYCVRIVSEERENLRRQLKEQFADPISSS